MSGADIDRAGARRRRRRCRSSAIRGGAILPIYDAVFRYNARASARRRRRADAADRAGQRAGRRASWPRAMRARRARSASASSRPGPGATNTVTPVRDCMADSIPIVVICGQVPTRGDRHATRSRKRRSATSWRACAKHVFLVTDRDASSKRRCAPHSRSRAPGGPGPVVVDIPKDVQNCAGACSRARARCRFRGYRAAHARDATARRSTTPRARRSSMLWRSRATADLRRRRRHRAGARGRAARFRARVRHPGRRRR